MNGICKRLIIGIRIERRREIEYNIDRVILERIEGEEIIFPDRYVSSEFKKRFIRTGFVATYKLGPAPARKVESVRGIGVNPDRVRPYPGISVQEMPCTDVFREA